MTENNINNQVSQNTQPTPVNPPVPNNAPQKPLNKLTPIIETIKSKTPKPVQDILAKFYSNKMIFWPVTIAFGLMFLVIILGLLFGSKTAPPPKTTAKPTPFVTINPPATPSGDVLTETETELGTLKNKINSLDIKQSPLKPPVFNFDIKF